MSTSGTADLRAIRRASFALDTGDPVGDGAYKQARAQATSHGISLASRALKVR